MGKSVSILFASFLMLLSAVNNAIGQGPFSGTRDTVTAPPRIYAMVMGISTYKYIRPLTYADSDAELFRDFLKSPAGGSLKDTSIYFLENEEAKQASFWIKGLSWLNAKNLQKGDKLYIYLAGHGDAINEDEFFFLAYDCNPAGDKNNYLITGTVQLYNLKAKMKRFVQKGVDVVFIMDACRSNELPGGGDGQQILNQAITEQKVGDIMMLASSAGQESLEDAGIGTGHGLFTYFLVDGLSGIADSAGVVDGKITLTELKSYVSKSVSDYAQQKYKRKQDPVFCCDEDNQKVVVNVDTAFLRKWILSKKLRGELNRGGSNSLAARTVKTRGKYDMAADTIILDLYNKFNRAIKDLNLTGTDNSAESIFNEMNKIAPASTYTHDAKYSLAAEFVNFAQSKVNLYLEGKDVASIQRIRSQLDDDDKTDEVGSSLDRMEKVARQDFSAVGEMLDKALTYLSTEEEGDLLSLQAMDFFFKAHGYFDKGGAKQIDLKQAIQFANTAYKANPKAAYILNTLASLHLDNNKPDSTIFYGKKAIEVAPQWRYPYANVANAFGKMNKTDSAISYFQKAIAIDAKRADAYVDLGYYFFQLKKPDSAKAYYEQALQVDPNNVYANNNMGWLLRELSQYKQAIVFFKKSLSVDPKFFNAYNGISRVFTDMGQQDSAKAYYQKAMQNYPDKLITSNYLGNFYRDNNQLDSAKNYLLEAAVLDPSYDAPFINLGKLFMSAKNYDSAKVYFRRVIDLNVNNFRGYNQMGLMFGEMKQFDSSQYYYKKAMELSPGSTIVLNNLGLNFLQQKNYDSASSYFKRIIQLAPDNPQANSNLGLVFYNMQQFDSARSYYMHALKIKPDLSSALSNMGLLLTKTNSYDEAKALFRSVLENNPANPTALRNLEYVFKQQHEYDSAVSVYQWVLNQGIENPELFISLGLLYNEQEKFTLAIESFSKAFEKNPGYARALYNIGFVYTQLKQSDSAASYYKKALAIDPGYFNAALNIGFTYIDMSQYDSSLVYLKKAVFLNPSYSGTYYYLARSFAQINKHEDAILYLRQALERGYNNYEYIMLEPDLAPIRKYPDFKNMMKKFFPKKYREQDDQ